MKATIIVVGNEQTPSSRIRGYRYQPQFEEEGWKVTFINGHDLYRLSSIYQLFTSRWVLIQKTIISELALRLLRLAGVRLFYDFDDAIYLQYSEARNQKFKQNLRFVHKVFAGNKVLANYAKPFQPSTVVLPTPVEIMQDKRMEVFGKRAEFVVGWIGTAPNLQYLDLVIPALAVLIREGYHITLRVISSKAPEMDTMVPVDFRPWSLETEDDLIDGFDIGVMPLYDTEWERGKCSYKLLSYMARGVPAIASPVGMNSDVVDHGENGFLATDMEDWTMAIRALVDRPELRKKFSERGLRTVKEAYAREVVFGTMKREVLLTLGG